MLILLLVLVWTIWTSTAAGRADIKQLFGDTDNSRGTSFILQLETSQKGSRDAGYLSFHVQQARNSPTDRDTSRHIRSVQDTRENSPVLIHLVDMPWGYWRLVPRTEIFRLSTMNTGKINADKST